MLPQGDARFQEGDNAGAMEMYNNAIAVDHTCAQAWWGKLKVQTGNFKVGLGAYVYARGIRK
mgnify:CR=1 FL=1